MIYFKPEGSNIRAYINDGNGLNWPFDHKVNHPSEATIISDYFQRQLEKRVSEIREKAYEDGYRDGRGRKKKMKGFCVTMNPKVTGWK